MLALDDLDHLTTQAPDTEIATPEPEPEAAVETQATTEATTEAPIPETAADGTTVEPGKTASEQAFGDQVTVPATQIDAGMYTPEQYKAACDAAGTPEKWDENYWAGYTEAQQWVQPYEGRYANNFELKVGQSASQAVKDFLVGPTISDFRVMEVAIEMDELRDNLGDQRFDQLFGSSNATDDARIPVSQRLKMNSSMYTIPFYDQMMEIAENSNAVDKVPEEPEAPAVAAGLEEKPETAAASQVTPEAIADELGMQREQEFV